MKTFKDPFRKVFFAEIRKTLFRGNFSQSQVNGINSLLDVWDENYTSSTSLYPLTHFAYCLATAFHETARTMQPVRETLAKSDKQAIYRLSRSKYTRNKTYWHRDKRTGESYYGRGYVQLTWKDNYEKAAKELSINCVSAPNLVMEPEIAAHILYEGCIEGWFTGKKLADYDTAKGFNWKQARRIVNGMDKADMIAAYAKEFYDALVTAEQALKRMSSNEMRTIPNVEEHVTGKKPLDSTTNIAALIAATGASVEMAAEQFTEVEETLDRVSAMTGLTTITLFGILICAAAVWIIRERVLKGRRDGV